MCIRDSLGDPNMTFIDDPRADPRIVAAAAMMEVAPGVESPGRDGDYEAALVYCSAVEEADAQAHPMLLEMIVGPVSRAAGVMMMTMVKGPAWMAIELPLYLVVAWLAGNIEQKRRAAGGTPAPAPAETEKAESEEA